MKNETVAKCMTEEEIRSILDPEGYTGLSGQIVDQVVRNVREAHKKYENA